MIDEEIDLQQCADELLPLLKEPVDRDVLLKELDEYINTYLLDKDSAFRIIQKDHGGADSDIILMPTPIIELNPGESVFVTAMVDSQMLSMRDDGSSTEYIAVHDNTGSVVIEIWNELLVLDIGSVYRFRNCSVKTNRYHSYPFLGYDGSEPDPVTDSGITSAYGSHVRNAVDADDLIEGMKNITVSGTVIRTYTYGPKFNSDIRIDGRDFNLICWNNTDIELGEDVCITNVDVGSYSGRIQIQITNDSAIIRRP